MDECGELRKRKRSIVKRFIQRCQHFRHGTPQLVIFLGKLFYIAELSCRVVLTLALYSGAYIHLVEKESGKLLYKLPAADATHRFCKFHKRSNRCDSYLLYPLLRCVCYMRHRLIPLLAFKIPALRIFLHKMLFYKVSFLERHRDCLALLFFGRQTHKTASYIPQYICARRIIRRFEKRLKESQHRLLRDRHGKIGEYRHIISCRRRIYCVLVFCGRSAYHRNIRVSVALTAYQLSDIRTHKISLAADRGRISHCYAVTVSLAILYPRL